MSSSSREDIGSTSLDTEYTPLLRSFGDIRKSISQTDNGSSSDGDSTETDAHGSNVLIISRVVDPLGPGLDTGLQQRLDLESTSYGSVHASSGSDQDHINDLSRLPQGRVANTEEIPSKYIGVSVVRFWLIFSGILAAYFVRSVIPE